MGMPSRRTNNFPSKWAWSRSRDPYNFGIRSNISLKLLELQTSNLIHGFVWECRAGAQIIFSKSGRTSRSVQWGTLANVVLFSLGAQMQTGGLYLTREG